MKVLKNRDNTQEWNKWREVDRELAIKEQIEKIGVPWVNEKDVNEELKELD